ncbi:LysR family transcriptional regulator [Pontixanthobacter aquaemixtae]|uniref:LysR family transcriptional regulator n=1 Tax=Pontixanthobacter aquaemixtae TaxID=1958940 RepID=A0A844ZRG1_9SPHN|nr:LysR family transcriptional regulator [Pontixanthobacter aquaemixtae]MXO89902.1 LysR family transcriptional regulator [Pontixanthobacter aquaemixtae]
MIDLRNLRHLSVLARQLNFSRAAEELGITQPALSRSIQALEDRLGLLLFDRDRGKVSLTPAGAKLAERAGYLLNDIVHIEREVRDEALGEAGAIRFGIAPMPARALLAPVLTARIGSAPRVANGVVVRDVPALRRQLLAGEIEFFISQEIEFEVGQEIKSAPLGEFPFSAIIRSGHPLCGDPKTTERFPLLRSSWAGMPVPQAIKASVFETPNVVEDFAALAEMVQHTDAIWLSSAYSIQPLIKAGTLVEHYPSRRRIAINTYSLRRRSQTALAKGVLAEFHAAMKSIIAAQ